MAAQHAATCRAPPPQVHRASPVTDTRALCAPSAAAFADLADPASLMHAACARGCAVRCIRSSSSTLPHCIPSADSFIRCVHHAQLTPSSCDAWGRHVHVHVMRRWEAWQARSESASEARSRHTRIYERRLAHRWHAPQVLQHEEQRLETMRQHANRASDSSGTARRAKGGWKMTHREVTLSDADVATIIERCARGEGAERVCGGRRGSGKCVWGECCVSARARWASREVSPYCRGAPIAAVASARAAVVAASVSRQCVHLHADEQLSGRVRARAARPIPDPRASHGGPSQPRLSHITTHPPTVECRALWQARRAAP